MYKIRLTFLEIKWSWYWGEPEGDGDKCNVERYHESIRWDDLLVLRDLSNFRN